MNQHQYLFEGALDSVTRANAREEVGAVAEVLPALVKAHLARMVSLGKRGFLKWRVS